MSTAGNFYSSNCHESPLSVYQLSSPLSVYQLSSPLLVYQLMRADLPLHQERFLQNEWSWENWAHFSESPAPHFLSKSWSPCRWCMATVEQASRAKKAANYFQPHKTSRANHNNSQGLYSPIYSKHVWDFDTTA